MPASLLASQLADYEPPDADERALRISSDRPLALQVAYVLAALAP